MSHFLVTPMLLYLCLYWFWYLYLYLYICICICICVSLTWWCCSSTMHTCTATTLPRQTLNCICFCCCISVSVKDFYTRGHSQPIFRKRLGLFCDRFYLSWVMTNVTIIWKKSKKWMSNWTWCHITFFSDVIQVWSNWMTLTVFLSSKVTYFLTQLSQNLTQTRPRHLLKTGCSCTYSAQVLGICISLSENRIYIWICISWVLLKS